MADEEKEEQGGYPLNLSQLYDLEEYATTYRSSTMGTAVRAVCELDLSVDSPEAKEIFKRSSTIGSLAGALPMFLQDSTIPYEERLEKIDRCRERIRQLDRELDAYIRQLRLAQESKDES